MQIKERISQFFSREDGATAIEYALMAVMVAVAITATVGDIRSSVQTVFTGINTALTK